jgi:hypothetical protein
MIRIVRSILILLLPLAIAFASCSGAPKHPAELASADSLNRSMISIDSVFRRIDTVAVRKAYEKITYSLGYIQYNLKDTLPREEGLFLSGFYYVRRPLGICTKAAKELRQKIKEELTQCGNLAHDLRHNTLSEKLDPKTCIRKEREHVMALAASAGTLAPAVFQAMKTYEEKFSGVQTKVDELKAKGGKEPPGSYTKKNEGDGDAD